MLSRLCSQFHPDWIVLTSNASGMPEQSSHVRFVTFYAEILQLYCRYEV